MFICDDCLKKNYENEEAYMKSLGRCELCKTRAVCNDIPSSWLVRKKK